MELGPGYHQDNIVIEVIEHKGRRILQVKSTDGRFTRRYALADDMTGEFEYYVNNGIMEMTLEKTPEVIDLDRETK